MSKNATVLDRWIAEWGCRFEAGEQALETVTVESDWALQTIQDAARRQKLPFFIWDCVAGYSRTIDDPIEDRGAFQRALAQVAGPGAANDPTLRDPLLALRFVNEVDLDDLGFARDRAVFILVNFYPYFNTDEVRQLFENLVRDNRLANGSKGRGRAIHFVQAPYAKFGLRGIEGIKHWMSPLPMPLADEDEVLATFVPELVDMVGTRTDFVVDHDPDLLRAVASAAVGLPRFKIVSNLFLATHRTRGISRKTVSEVASLTASELARAGTMEIVPESKIIPPEELGGIGRVVAALEEAAEAYTDAAVTQKLDPPLGLFFCGVAGTGKTAVALASAVIFERATGVPWRVVRVRSGAFFGGLVGETEQNWYDFEDRIQAFGSCIVFFDEVDKLLGGVADRQGDSGVSRSLFGLWLAWMGNPDRRCYVILAMNDPSGIPDEALREGRIDGGFFFDLPDAETAATILKIHLEKRLKVHGLAWPGYSASEWAALGDALAGARPSDIEGVAKKARQVAFRSRGLAVPTFAETMGVLEDRRRVLEANDEAREARGEMVARVDDLRRRCRAKGAEPAHLKAPSRPILTSASEPIGRKRRGSSPSHIEEN